jgi:beta-lactamase class A
MKYLSLLIVVISFVCLPAFADTQPQMQLDQLEKNFAGKIGVYAIDTNTNQIIMQHAGDRFPVQSTMKLIAVAALLKQSDKSPNLLQEKIHYTKNDLMYWHPVTGQYITTGMTLAALAEAAISYSDNVAANLIIKKLGGPQAATAFARSISNPSFNVKHYEGDLNSNPQNTEDTSTPEDMAISVQKLTTGDILTPLQRAQLITWMRNDTVGYKKIRAGVPIGWIVADKTGSGDYGIANDIGILWSPTCKPIVLAIYTIQNKQNASSRDDIVATTTNTVLSMFAKHDACFKALSA